VVVSASSERIGPDPGVLGHIASGR
jgi:hypothetical protein